MNNKVKNMVGIGLFTAIVVVLQFLGGGIKVMGMFSISLVLVPIVVGSAVYGWKAGAILGAAFGFAVLLSGDATSFLVVDPLPFGMATILVVMSKGTLCGLTAGLMYKLLSKWNRIVAVVVSGIVCPIVNTGVFLIGCQVFFLPTITEWALSMGYPNAANYMFFGLAGINFLIELGVNIVLSPIILRIINLGRK